jgi:hypothetical protein
MLVDARGCTSCPQYGRPQMFRLETVLKDRRSYAMLWPAEGQRSLMQSLMLTIYAWGHYSSIIPRYSSVLFDALCSMLHAPCSMLHAPCSMLLNSLIRSYCELPQGTLDSTGSSRPAAGRGRRCAIVRSPSLRHPRHTPCRDVRRPTPEKQSHAPPPKTTRLLIQDQ